MNDTIKEKDRSLAKTDKHPWKMTKSEYESIFGPPRGNSTVTGSFSKHRSAVEIALNRGLKVPEEVLKDYPDLMDV